MSEVNNTNVFDASRKFVDFAGLDYFWSKAKTYIDDVDATMSTKVLANETAIKGIQDELNTLSGGVGSVGTQIDNAIAALDLPGTYDAKGSAAQALVDAKAYTDGKVDGKFDATGSAAQALVDAKAYADNLNTAMDTRVDVLEAIDHEKLATDAAAAAVATVLDGAPEAFDTLKEVAEWIAASDSAAEAADLVTRVGALEAINHDAYIAADETNLASAKAYTDEEIGKLSFDAAGSAAQALVDAKAYTDGKVDGKFDAAGSAEAAAAQALVDAKAYTDGKVDGKFDAAGSAAAAQAAAIAQASADAAETLKSYYTKTEVDNLLSTNSTADQAYAKTYTDALYNSFKFAGYSDIDGMFNKA